MKPVQNLSSPGQSTFWGQQRRLLLQVPFAWYNLHKAPGVGRDSPSLQLCARERARPHRLLHADGNASRGWSQKGDSGW